MTRGINEIELIDLAIAGLVTQGGGLCLDGDAALPLEVHGVKNLSLHLAVGQAAAELNHSICKGALSVIDVGND